MLRSSFQRLGQLPKFCGGRWSSSAVQFRNELFSLEQQRQKEAVGRIEKIEVRFLGVPEDATLLMNKNVSTPHDCAQHLSDHHCNRSVLALLDGNQPWDMHRPIENECTIQLLTFEDADPYLANRTFWRSCSFLLGAALGKCFKDGIRVQFHSFPSPNVRSGSFLYDIALDHLDWQTTKPELQAISAEMIKMAASDLRFERLEVATDLALQMFEDSKYKKEQLPSISRDGVVVLYRVGDFIDISRGPMMGSTSHLGKTSIVATHKLEEIDAENAFYRVQGVALPKKVVLNHVAYGILEERARQLNPARLPSEPFEESLKNHLA